MGKVTFWVLMGLFVGGLALNSYADIVKLKSGAKVEGVVKEEKDKVTVEMGLGTVTIDKGDVLSIEKKRSKLEDYQGKYDEIRGSQNAKDFYELARWCEENKLTRYTRDLLKRVIELDPNHEIARRELGYQLHQSKWMTREEVMIAKGFILFRGQWMTEAERELILGQEKEAALKAEIARQERERQKEEELQKRKELARERAIEAQLYQPTGLTLPAGPQGEYPYGYYQNSYYRPYGGYYSYPRSLWWNVPLDYTIPFTFTPGVGFLPSGVTTTTPRTLR